MSKTQSASTSDPAKKTFEIKESVFRNFISAKPGSKFPPEKNRYHLYVALSCPFAQRAMIVRRLKGLTSIIGLSIVHWSKGENGWRFINSTELASRKDESDVSNGTVDHLYNNETISQFYFKTQADYVGKYTVPVLWDKKSGVIVNNESSEIIRMFNSEFNSLLPSEYAQICVYPEGLQSKVDELNSWIFDHINITVYKTGFAKDQASYSENVKDLFHSLDHLESVLKENHVKYSTDPKKNNFLLGKDLTEADIRLFPTLIRFDPVYVQLYKCNIKQIRDYPYLNSWLQSLYWNIPAFKETTDFDHIKLGYYDTAELNPSRITPVGPIPDILPIES